AQELIDRSGALRLLLFLSVFFLFFFLRLLLLGEPVVVHFPAHRILHPWWNRTDNAAPTTAVPCRNFPLFPLARPPPAFDHVRSTPSSFPLPDGRGELRNQCRRGRQACPTIHAMTTPRERRRGCPDWKSRSCIAARATPKPKHSRSRCMPCPRSKPLAVISRPPTRWLFGRRPCRWHGCRGSEQAVR